MKVIKRNGSEVSFDIAKIIAAITKANESVDEAIRMTPMQIQRIAESVEFSCLKMNRSPSVEGLLRPAHAQLRPCESGGYAAKRHCHHRHAH